MDHYNEKRYLEWEARQMEWVRLQAMEMVDDYYQRNIVWGTFSVDASKMCVTYAMLKIWHILDGSGILMDETISKRKDRVIITYWLHPANKDDDKTDEESSEPE